MFIQEETIADQRPALAVFAPDREFLLKYFDRAFDCRITENIDDATEKNAITILGINEPVSHKAQEFIKLAKAQDKNIITLRVPHVIGTGMGGTMLRLARRVARGSQFQIRDDNTKWSVIHATDIAAAALTIASNNESDVEYTISAPPITVNDLLDALSHRIKNKRIGTISPRWAKILYGGELFKMLSTENIVDTSAFSTHYPNFKFINPADYLRTHDYDDESL